MNRPLTLLQDVKVLAFTQFLLGPAATQYLADMGAEVTKIEQPGTGSYERRWSGSRAYPGGESAFFLLAHRNVRSVTLNLKHPKGIEVAKRLAADSDVVVSNFRPGVLERMGLGYDDLTRIKHDLVYACASGYGTDSPHRHLPGQDLLLQAMTGLAAVTGRSNEPPTAAGAAIVDQHAASLLALGILGALRHRDRTGEGQHIEVTMVQAALDIQIEPVTYHLNGGAVHRPTEPLASGFHEAPYGFYATSDGYIALSLSPIRLISEVLESPAELRPYEDPDLAFTHREEIHRALAPLLKDKGAAEWVELFRTNGIWCAPVNDYDSAFADPIVQDTDPLLEISHPRAGPVRLLKHPIRYGSGEPETRTPPGLGEHTDEVLQTAGYSPTQITELRQHGAV